MKKFNSSKPYMLFRYWIEIAVFFLCVLSVGYISAQTKNPYKIAVYEKNRRLSHNAAEKKYRYEIRSLFIKNDSGWVKCVDSINENYRQVYSGKEYWNVKAICCTYVPDYDGANKYTGVVKDYGFFTPKPVVLLNENYLLKPFENNDANEIEKASLLSNNPFFRQSTRLAYYMPSTQEQRWLLDTIKFYLSSLFKLNPACIAKLNSYMDTAIKYNITNKNSIAIDTANSFIDKQGNKLINILFPARTQWSFYYPFNKECGREDDGFKDYKILCYINSNGKLIFLRDELQYLDHGDFDNDGKDEFLFWTTRHNHDGYVMYYDDFKKSVTYLWSYH